MLIILIYSCDLTGDHDDDVIVVPVIIFVFLYRLRPDTGS